MPRDVSSSPLEVPTSLASATSRAAGLASAGTLLEALLEPVCACEPKL